MENLFLDFNYYDRGKDSLSNVHHSHGKCFEFVFVLSGEGTFLIDDVVFPIKPNHLYIIDGMCTHCSVPAIPEDYSRRKLVVNGAVLESIIDSFGDRSLLSDLFAGGGRCIIPSQKYVDIINDIFFEIDQALSKDISYKPVRIRHQITNLLLVAADSANENNSPYDQNITEILKYIGENYTRNLSLDEISESTHLSKYYLCHLFKKSLNMSVFDYILSKRISHAKSQLINTDLSISNIAMSVGFTDFSYFGKLFKKFEGVTPKEYRMINK